ncbi:MAG: DMT family transporter [Lentisphaerae bacterium]|jgi:drug/metabolite transporter (DMT)-like permease|nr:DMT family transporter [Lentisphaerota bacterium]
MTDRAKGIFAITASAFGFALMAFFVRLCDEFGGPVSSFQKSLFRNIIAFAIALFVYLRQGADNEGGASQRMFPPCMGAKAWFLLVLRSVSGGIGIFGNFYALGKIPIGEAMTLNKTAPFFTVLFSWLFLREKASARRLLWILLAFVGAMLVMKPGFQGTATFATLCALGGGLGAGIAYTCVRELGILKVNGAFIVLFFSAFSTLACIPFIAWQGADPMTFAQTLTLLGAGCGAAVGQFGVTAAYRFAPPNQIAVFDYTNVIFTSLLGFAFLSPRQVPDLLSALGFAIIVLAAIRSRRT